MSGVEVPLESPSVMIVTAATRVARERGLSAVSLGRVALASGLDPAIVARYEPSMTALAASVFTAIALEELDAARETVRGWDSSVAILRYLSEELVAESHDQETSIWADAWSLGRRSPLIAAAASACTTRWTDFVRDIIEEGTRGGEFSTADAQFVSDSFVALLDSVCTYALIGHGTAKERTSLLKAFLESALLLPPSTL
jgi:AcrR family transcriptional regulator